MPIERASSRAKYPSQQEARDCVANGSMKFERWSKTYDYWMGGLQDWCISRQLWWGHRIPVWYAVRKFTAVWRHRGQAGCRTLMCSTRGAVHGCVICHDGLADDTETLKKFYPTTDLVTGPDIIFWVARMIAGTNGRICLFVTSISPASSATRKAGRCPRASVTARSARAYCQVWRGRFALRHHAQRAAGIGCLMKRTWSSVATSTSCGTPAVSARCRAVKSKAKSSRAAY